MDSEDTVCARDIDIDFESISHDIEEPKDKCKLVHLIFFFLGIGVLLPWNCLINPTHYFQYQLRNTSLPPKVDALLPEFRTQNQKIFTNNLAICSVIPRLVSHLLNLLLKDFLSAFNRLFCSGMVVLIMLFTTSILTAVEIDASIFLGVTLASVVLMSIAISINEGSLYGILSVLPPSNACIFVQGQALAGVLVAVVNIITIAASSDEITVGFVNFLIPILFITMAMLLYCVLPRSAYFNYYWQQNTTIQTTEVETSKCVQLKRTVVNLFKTMWEVRWTGSVIWITFAVTLTIFPGMLVLVVPNNFDAKNAWQSKYFHAVMVFLSFNISEYLGQMAVLVIKWPTFSQRGLLLSLSILRVILIPLTYYCNLQPRHTPAYFYHDSIPIIIVILLGFTEGYLFMLAVIYSSRYASPGNEESCGIATATYISLGECTGVAISYGIVALF